MEEEIIYTRTSVAKNKINEVSAMIKVLKITNEENDVLVAALTELLCIVEKEAFVQGVNMTLIIFGSKKLIEVEHAN